MDYSSSQASSPSAFQFITPGAPGTDGFVDVMTLSFSVTSHDDSEAADHMSSIHGDFNYALTGTLGVNGDQIRVIVTAAAYMHFNHHEVEVNYEDLEGANYYNKTQTVLFTLGVGPDGKLAVVQTNSLVDNSTPWNFTPGGILGVFGFESDIKSGLGNVQSSLDTFLDKAFTGYVKSVTDEVNGYHGWVFPGANTFVLSHLLFSSGQDLVSQLVYANPN